MNEVTRPRRICICTDDFGIDAAVDSAVLGLAERGRMSATSCMVGGPSWAQGSALLREVARGGRFDAGLHLDLGDYPFDRTLLQPVSRWIVDTLTRRVDRVRLRAEIRAQLDRFESAMGFEPAHIDGHQHVHQFPVIRDVLMDELMRRYTTGHRPWLRNTRGAARSALKGWVIEGMGAAALQRAASTHGFEQNRSLLGVYDLRPDAHRFHSLLRGWLHAARDGDLLMCHVAQARVPGDEIARTRVAEYEVFAGDSFSEDMRAANTVIEPMSRILAAPPVA